MKDFQDYLILRITLIISCLAGVLLILFGGIKTAANFRILSDFIQNILIITIVLLVFMPDNRNLKVALFMGIFILILDFVLETLAVYLNWWYPLGGTQFPPLIVVPIEMVISFMLIGTSMGVILTFPEKMRENEIPVLAKIFENPKYDYVWRILFLFGNAIIGTNGDYIAGPAIWAPGPLWHPIFTFFVWFGGSMAGLLIFYLFRKKYEIE